ncbi:YggT family protein [Candidatus Microgenomates bacterium]|nr:YggT family protein [Candidatus Microgenomates bacterium]
MRPSAAVAWLTQVTLWAVWLLLGGRFILRLLNADATNRVVDWFYDMSQPAITKFTEWFPSVRLGDGFNLDLATLFALVVYSLIGFAILAVVGAYSRKADSVVPKSTFGFSISRKN